MINIDTLQEHIDSVTNKTGLQCPVCYCKDWTAAAEPVRVQTGYMVADPLIAKLALLTCDCCHYTMMFSYQDKWNEEVGLTAALTANGESVDPDMLLPTEDAEDMNFTGWGDELPNAQDTIPDLPDGTEKQESGPESFSKPEPEKIEEPEDDQVSVLGAAKDDSEWVEERRGPAIVRYKKTKNPTVQKRKIASPDTSLGGAVDEHSEAQKREAMMKKLYDLNDGDGNE